MTQRSSKLDPVQGESLRRLEQHADSAPQVFQRVKERGCPGRSTILRAFVRFGALCPQAHGDNQPLEQRRRNPQHPLQKIVALSELDGAEAAARALEDAFT